MGRAEPDAEEQQQLLGNGPGGVEVQETAAAVAPVVANADAASSPLSPATLSTECKTLVIPVNAPAPAATPPQDAAPTSAPVVDPLLHSSKEPALCRICFEEDVTGNLEQPCGCSGTQMYAHHACIQRWVEEKGHLKCEVCEQDYKGAFQVPPPPPPTATSEAGTHPIFAPMLFRVDGDDAAARASALELYDEQDQYHQRHPGTSWCFTFIIFVMFLVVLHHTMVVADGVDGGTDAGGMPGPGGGDMGPENDEYATSLTLFLFWVGTKAFLIGIPLYTVMKVAARQARREQYEAMFGAGQLAADGRIVLRMRQGARHDGGGPGQQPVGPNAV